MMAAEDGVEYQRKDELMRINVYAEELTDRIEVVTATVDGVKFTGVRFYLYLPVTVMVNAEGVPINERGPFLTQPVDDNSGAITLWGKPGQDISAIFEKAVRLLKGAETLTR